MKAALAIAVEPCNLRQPVLGRNISLGYFIDFDFYSYVSQIDHLGVAQFTRVPWQQTKLLTVGFPHDPGPKITINPQALMAAHQNQSITMPGSTIFSFTPQLDVWLRR